MQKFSNLIVLSPLIYLVHHFEEHIIYNFRENDIKSGGDGAPLVPLFPIFPLSPNNPCLLYTSPSPRD